MLMSNNRNIKPIAFYLPQFHTIPENDQAHGFGFTEWTNTQKATPLFDGHYQPKTPLNKNYYCLLDEGVMEKQANMANKYGIYGFCYYHYWFKDGKKLLEKPIENMLKNKSIDIPFCLCWANENWTKRWDGGNNEIIVEQNYGDFEDLKRHIDYLCDFFRDERYIKVNNKPILLIYKPELIPNLKKVVKCIRKRVHENGFEGVYLIVQYPQYFFEGVNLRLFDNYIQFQPVFAQYLEHEKALNSFYKALRKVVIFTGLKECGMRLKNKRKKVIRELTHRDYDLEWQSILEYQVKDKRLIAGAFVDWDNTARNKNGVVYDGGNPDKFEKYMAQLVEKVNEEYEEEFIFINAWNEWAEGAYLEPDEKYKFAYLEAISRVLS